MGTEDTEQGSPMTAEHAAGKVPRTASSSHAAAQVRDVLAEHVVVSTALDPFFPLRALATYAGLSVRTLRQYLDLPPHQALPCYRVGGKILVRRSEFDAWVARYQSRGRPELARVLKELGLDKEDV
jgi:hypothetical protein